VAQRHAAGRSFDLESFGATPRVAGTFENGAATRGNQENDFLSLVHGIRGLFDFCFIISFLIYYFGFCFIILFLVYHFIIISLINIKRVGYEPGILLYCSRLINLTLRV
jgi:hypothetical protein